MHKLWQRHDRITFKKQAGETIKSSYLNLNKHRAKNEAILSLDTPQQWVSPAQVSY